MFDKFNNLDVIIIGGGPGGLSAAFWCAELGLRAVLFEKESEFGGQLLWTFNAIKNYLAVEAASGRELRDRFLQHIKNADVMLVTRSPVVSADLGRKRITLANGTNYSAKAIIIATGVRRRKLDVPGEEEFSGRGILDSGAKSKDEVRGKTVAIVGGGDAALENALILSKTAEKVYVIHRRDEFTARNEFIEKARKCQNVNFILDTSVSAILGNERVESVETHHTKSGDRSKLTADKVLVRIGVIPNTELFRGQIVLDAAGFVCIDNSCSTKLAGVCAVGDVANHFAPTISAAVGMGSTALKFIARNMAAD